MNPQWGLWKHLFFVKRQTGKGGSGSFAVGSLSVQVRSDVEYFDLHMLESVQGWRKKWFYIRDEPGASQLYGLPEFAPDATVTKKKSWKHRLPATEEVEANRLLAQVMALTTPGKEVTGIHLISTFIRQRIQLLQARVQAMWGYEGPLDPTRTRKEDLSNDELESRVRAITTLKIDDPCTGRPPVAPYGEGKDLSEGHIILARYPPLPENGAIPENDESEASSSSLPAAD